MAFSSSEGNLQEIFLTQHELIDQFVNGTLWRWGYNTVGQLGDNTTTNKSSPVVGPTIWWKSIDCGINHSSAILDGYLYSWGYNEFGQLGDNTTDHKSYAVEIISSGTNWKSVVCGGNHTTAIKTDGTLWLWGHNYYGSLGDGTLIHRSSPVQTIAGGTNWKLVTGGGFHTAAIKTDGTLWTWGHNNAGQLGDDTIIDKSSPVQTLTSGTNWKLVSSGWYHTAAIKTDGTLWLWGWNNYGPLGDNTTIHRSSPIQTVAGGTNWKSVACGFAHTTALTYGDN